ncbi:MAG: hypothetical protein QF441_08855 [Bacteriovoracaceae bacterium]|nr:hypothetical protein [Bacteriovoracaceae bacterium]
MISIEKEDTEQNKKRIKFNKPFSCIDVIFGDSKDVLPDLDYSVRSNIVWLDYDSKLNSSSLEDVETISAKLGHGDLFVMSINVACPDRNLDELKQNVGSENIPRDAKKIDVGAKDMAKTCKKIVYDKIQANLIDRNLELGDEEKLAFSPLMYFYYRDGAPMATFGGIFVKEADLGSGIIDPFKELSFARIGDEFMQLESPCLTFKEIIELNQLLPGDTIDEIERKLPVPRSEIEHFEEIYKYFPYFLSIEGF